MWSICNVNARQNRRTMESNKFRADGSSSSSQHARTHVSNSSVNARLLSLNGWFRCEGKVFPLKVYVCGANRIRVGLFYAPATLHVLARRSRDSHGMILAFPSEWRYTNAMRTDWFFPSARFYGRLMCRPIAVHLIGITAKAIFFRNRFDGHQLTRQIH